MELLNFTPSDQPVFYKINTLYNDNDNIISWQCIRGLVSNENSKIIFRHISINTFEDIPTEIPDNALIDDYPSQEWIKKYFINPDMFLIERPNNRPSGTDGFPWYRIEDNGGMPYVAYVDSNTQETYVFKFPHNGYINEDISDDRYMINYYTECVFHFKRPIKTWIGIDDKDGCHGNSILIQVSNKTYIYIGSEIKIFVSKDPIVAYYSIMGNSMVPYPVALTEKEVFFMLDSVRITKSEIEQLLPFKNGTKEKYWGDAYSIFYQNENKLKKTPFDTIEKHLKIANRNALWSRMITSFKERYYDPNKGKFIKIAAKRFKRYIS